MADGLPRQIARTKRFTAGAPHDFAVVPDGSVAIYLRDSELWAYDIDAGTERRIAPADSYAIDRAPVAAVLRESQLWLADPRGDRVERLVESGARLACPDPTGTVVSYVRDDALRVVDADGTNDRALLTPDADEVSYGVPATAEWMPIGPGRGYCWAPDGTRLLVARVDLRPVRTLWLSDPTDPAATPKAVRYPSTGTPNPDVSVHIVDVSGNRVDVEWDRERFEYVLRLDWRTRNPLLAVQSRDQRVVRLLNVDPDSGATALVREITDPAWVDVPDGVPTRTASGELVWIEPDLPHDTNRLRVGDRFVTPPGLQVRRVSAVDGDTVSLLAQPDPTETHLYVYEDGEFRQLSKQPGVHDGMRVRGRTVLESSTFDGHRVTVDGQPVTSYEERPELELRVELIRAGHRELRTAVFRPSWHQAEGGKLPVLVNPYAGPAMQLAVASRHWHYLLSQWFAEQGFIVVTADGRGTPGRGPAFQRAIHGDLAGVVLDDQVEALHAVADRYGDLDLERVAIRGWSFSGFLAAAAVLHRPETFHAAVAGAPVVDQRMYNSHWKERFLGDPEQDRDAYRRSSLLPYAEQLSRPLLIVQGLVDTNVWSLHALRLSTALLAAGKPHSVLPLPGQGHRPLDEDVVANLPAVELDFIRNALSTRTA